MLVVVCSAFTTAANSSNRQQTDITTSITESRDRSNRTAERHLLRCTFSYSCSTELPCCASFIARRHGGRHRQR